jgi:hypothetical protein
MQHTRNHQGCLLFHVRVRARSARGNEAVDARFEDRQRHGAELEYGVVEGADVEPRPERGLGLGARLQAM